MTPLDEKARNAAKELLFRLGELGMSEMPEPEVERYLAAFARDHAHDVLREAADEAQRAADEQNPTAITLGRAWAGTADWLRELAQPPHEETTTKCNTKPHSAC